LTLALRLHRLGWTPIVLELASSLRGEGYMIDFFGPGYDVAERMGLIERLRAIHRPIPRFVFVDADGHERFALQYPSLRRRLFGGRHFNFLRGDLESALFDALEGAVAIRFGTSVVSLVQDDATVWAVLSDGTRERVDLVVGADGVHSRVRSLVLGEERWFRLSLGHVVGAWILDKRPDMVSSDAFWTLTAPGRMVAVYPIDGGRAATFFVHRSADPAAELARGACATLRSAYADLGWIVPHLLESLTDGVYLDEVVQIELDRWSCGRVAILGDAAWCVSPLGGLGASLAMAGADSLASALGCQGVVDIPVALKDWEERFRPGVTLMQQASRRTAAWFVPSDQWHSFVRDLFLRASTWPITSEFLRWRLGLRRRPQAG
jgi:2-polyprenyl-6-methoxyphenol hydroxylase-like FAD-dependent oxidoreductase